MDRVWIDTKGKYTFLVNDEEMKKQKREVALTLVNAMPPFINPKVAKKAIKEAWGVPLYKKPVERDKEYLAFVHNFPCFVCGAKDIQAAHTEHKGMGIKGSDYSVVNLCVECHLGNHGLDTIGREQFEKEHNVDLNKQQIFLLKEYIKHLKEKK